MKENWHASSNAIGAQISLRRDPIFIKQNTPKATVNPAATSGISIPK
jgi:hypothetical protein